MSDHAPETFLSLVANDLISRFGTDLSDVIVVFPNIRASLFFNSHLYRCSQAPLWAPQYTSIESLFEKLSPLNKGDSIFLINELYKSYIQVYNRYATTPSSETLDEFFFFGEILLNDFDDLDKNLVHAKALFTNLKDLDALKDDFTHLSEDQIQALIRHFKHVFQGESELKTAFWNIWNILGEVYTSFREILFSKQIAYPGMLMRSVVENENTNLQCKHIAFVGFNVLSKCEQSLFQQLKDKASFYWDYDSYYIDTEAGRFIKKNIQKLGSALDPALMNNFLPKKKNITFLAAPSESAQTSVVPGWISHLRDKTDFIKPDSAIVLSNEAVLPAVMQTIPDEKVNNVNITMGFPITLTAISSYIQVLTEMQTKAYRAKDQSFWYKYVLPVLRHPYTKLIFPEAKEVEKELVKNNIFYPAIDQLKDALIFTYARTTVDLAKYLIDIIQKVGSMYRSNPISSDPYNGLYQESVFRAYQVLNRLYGLIHTENLKIEKATFLRLIKKILSTVQIPFHGEPVKGLQIMGVLETRTLDFKNVLLMSVNEGFMPANRNDNTFIPQFLRVYFEMSTVDHQDSIYSYYFYRSIQRAENITFVYNTDKTAMGKAEISRFLLQLIVDPQLKGKINRFSLHSSIKPWQPDPVVIDKDNAILTLLKSKYDLNTNLYAQTLSPTALNTYMDCSYKFYLEYIKELREKEELADELDNSVFGSIFHQAAENLYREIGRIEENMSFIPFVVEKQHFDRYEQFPHLINKLVIRAFETVYFKGSKVIEEDFNGEQLINFHVVCKMIERLIRFDKKRTPFTIYGLEWRVKEEYLLPQKNIRINIGGIIDRLEEKDGSYYILDYKTGGRAKEYKMLEDLFALKENRASHIFQTFVYASALSRKKEFNRPVVPALLYMQQASKDDYSPVVLKEKEPITDFKSMNAEFETLLIDKMEEIFNGEISFQQTPILSNCEYCNFREMCNR
ncbi:MAG: PD-(D/E)XK nuclease family protein [Bacteroidales bacterium]|nr:PD-(D/E)XK nuclease family protein [Bacteroidales bacterium]